MTTHVYLNGMRLSEGHVETGDYVLSESGDNIIFNYASPFRCRLVIDRFTPDGRLMHTSTHEFLDGIDKKIPYRIP